MGGEQANVPQWKKLVREEDRGRGGGRGRTAAVDAEETR